jgi:hypothetical protein
MTGTTSDDHLALLAGARVFNEDRLWAVEDCRHLSRRLERDLLSAGERIVQVPPKLMAHAARPARSYVKVRRPHPALAVARAALGEPDLPTARAWQPRSSTVVCIDSENHHGCRAPIKPHRSVRQFPGGAQNGTRPSIGKTWWSDPRERRRR